MSKEIMRIGPITGTILAEISYRQLRNGETDFTLAREKPKLNSQINCNTTENKGMICEATSSNVTIRANTIGAEILTKCNGKNKIEDIAYDLAEIYDFDDDKFVEQVKTFLNIFKTYKFI